MSLRPIRVLAAPGAGAPSHLVQQALLDAGHDAVWARDHAELLRLALVPPTPDVVLIDGGEREGAAPQACRDLHQLLGRSSILVLGSLAGTSTAAACLRAGAHEVLETPLAPDTLLAKIQAVRLAREQRERATRGALWGALTRAASAGSGELVVADGQRSARVYFHRGGIVWVHLVGDDASVNDLMPADCALDEATSTLLLEDCRTRRQSLSETLIDWGLIDRGRLEESVRGWLRARLAAVLSFEVPLTIFVAQAYGESSQLVFSLDDLVESPPVDRRDSGVVTLPDRAPSLSRRAWRGAFFHVPAPSESALALVAGAMKLQGACGAALLDVEDGICLGSSGDSLDADVAWSFVRILHTDSSRSSAADIAATIGGHYHLARVLTDARLALYVVIRGSEARLATSLVEFRMLVDRAPRAALAGGEPPRSEAVPTELRGYSPPGVSAASAR